MITAVDKLKAITDAGYRVYVSHVRNVEKWVPETRNTLDHMLGQWLDMMTAREATADGWTILPNGGSTTVEIRRVDRGQTFQIGLGESRCSQVDRFERRKGLELALGRAIADAPELRAVIKEMVAAKAATA